MHVQSVQCPGSRSQVFGPDQMRELYGLEWMDDTCPMQHLKYCTGTKDEEEK